MLTNNDELFFITGSVKSGESGRPGIWRGIEGLPSILNVSKVEMTDFAIQSENKFSLDVLS